MLGRLLQNSPLVYKPTEAEMELGVQEGRSERCVSVDREGRPDSNLDIGVFKVGNMWFDDTEVELKLDLVDANIDPSMVGNRGISRRRQSPNQSRRAKSRALSKLRRKWTVTSIAWYLPKR